MIGWQSVIQERDSAAPTPEDTGTAAPGEMARPVKCPAGRRSNPRLPRSPVSAGTAEAQRGGKCDGANGDRPISDRQHVRAPAVGVAAGGRCIKLQPLSAQGGGLAPRSDSSPTRWPEKFVGACSFLRRGRTHLRPGGRRSLSGRARLQRPSSSGAVAAVGLRVCVRGRRFSAMVTVIFRVLCP